MALARVRFPLPFFLALVAAASPAEPQASARARPPLTLQQQLDGWFARAARTAPGTWGIAVANQEGQLIWGVQPTRSMIPASTVKVFTTGFARSVLGSDARKHTRVVGSGHIDPSTGAWAGSWALELNGDVTLERRSHGGPTLADLAEQLSAAGIRKLVGPLNVVSSAGAAGASYPSAWSPRHNGRVFAPLIGSLTLNENVLSFAIAPG
ncbi:MAG TPA: D-alanyl-D-alanine carboxypeptidase, partial [Gemmatimonadales bacterium]